MDKRDEHWSKTKHGDDGMRKGNKNERPPPPPPSVRAAGHTQPFGCTLAVADDSSFRLLAFSENAADLLDLSPHHSVPSLDSSAAPPPVSLGADARLLFSPSSGVLLERAFAAREISLLNPLWIHSRVSSKPFYAILHRIDVGVVIDLEPARTEDPALSIAGAVQSQKLAVRAISRLQALPGGDVKLLCDTVVEHVRELTGYDRVMVYKFHDDEHGEVLAESRRGDLEPYLGLHYPATDIPQASRFLFRQNRVRMIADCHAAAIACHIGHVDAMEVRAASVARMATRRPSGDAPASY
ncbi:Phytochrome B [Triticum urartu]|uniref:Phytochrome B n=1 Tax=Triticum urartu TaxID=4572 RepID=M7ZJX9_TRIUA|nr:Phytochrome B [Triticum urartu]